MYIECTTFGEQDSDLLVLRRVATLGQSCTALATELGHRAPLCAAGTAEQLRRGLSAAIGKRSISLCAAMADVCDVLPNARPSAEFREALRRLHSVPDEQAV